MSFWGWKRHDKTKREWLEPKFDGCKSFYKKAYIERRSNGDKVLISYNTPVVVIHKGIPQLLDSALCSCTTRRHTYEFLRQEGVFKRAFPRAFDKRFPNGQEKLRDKITVAKWDKRI